MQVREVIEEFRLEPGVRELNFDAFEILTKAERLLRDLSHKESWSFFNRHANPVAKTHTGVREYPLPDDFGSNFIRGADDDGSRYLCKISNGSSENFLDYKVPAQFFGTDFEAASNSTPESFTVVADAAGYQQIWLDPPPDSNSDSHYTIRGVYSPTFSHMTLDSWVPEEVSSYLVHGLLFRVQPDNPNHQREFILSRQALYMEEARLRETTLQSKEGEVAGHDGWTGEFQS